jgi:hypothetical protein
MKRSAEKMPSSLRLGRVAGIEIGVHYTWLFAFFLITWSLAGGYFPAAYPGWSPATYWAVSAVAALALFASVLIHELMHSFVALTRGLEVSSITLFIFGGVSNLKTEAHQPLGRTPGEHDHARHRAHSRCAQYQAVGPGAIVFPSLLGGASLPPGARFPVQAAGADP